MPFSEHGDGDDLNEQRLARDIKPSLRHLHQPCVLWVKSRPTTKNIYIYSTFKLERITSSLYIKFSLKSIHLYIMNRTFGKNNNCYISVLKKRENLGCYS